MFIYLIINFELVLLLLAGCILLSNNSMKNIICRLIKLINVFLSLRVLGYFPLAPAGVSFYFVKAIYGN